ncbi:MAG TPA: minichromosome maintenance protein MCM [Candidatus Aenigmarchaeota archaeon]|nr:MAG: AAA family ATPase [Candidatus Aenigmarchaeota archaeon]HDD46233.1 minichromosome maintenance protein MCM [Candidatus Aenigmarchaeota archaeon]
MEKYEITEGDVSKFVAFLDSVYRNELIVCANEGKPLVLDFIEIDKFNPEMGEILSNNPDEFFKIIEEAIDRLSLPAKVKIRVKGAKEVRIRDLRARHIGKFITIEGIVRKASEIRPEIVETVWECPECGAKINQPRRGGFVVRPFQCPECGNKKGFRDLEKKMIDTRWIVIEEPFELTEGEKPSQLTVLLTEDLVSPEGRRNTDPGNRLKITGTLRDIPKGKAQSVKLDFYLEANHVDPVEVGWHNLEITKEDEEKIKALAKEKDIYERLIDSIAPSLYGMREIKEAIVLQLFGGVKRTLRDGTRFRGDIHILIIGDPSSGKSQLLKLVPTLVPRGKYVSGKGVTGAGLTATVTKDEQFMGGWVLEAGALVLANKGLLAVDEFEKMNKDDQIAMHEALEQGTISIAKASIVATLPAQTSLLAGGNPKFSRFDPYMPISKQITIPETLLTRFDLKFALRDEPNAELDKKISEHVLKSREEEYELTKPKIDIDLIRKYVAYAKEHCNPVLTKEAGKILQKFYVDMRKRAEAGGAVPITLRQFEALIRLSEASARVQLSDVVRKEDAKRAIRLMKYSLMQLGFDYETGQIDIDRTEGAVTSKERSKIRIVLDIINELSTKMKEVPISEIEKSAREEGIDKTDEIQEIIEKLKREGLLFEPSPGYVQKI